MKNLVQTTELHVINSFAELFGGNTATDRVRQQQLPKVGPTLDYVDEAFTSENWIVSLVYSRFVVVHSLIDHSRCAFTK